MPQPPKFVQTFLSNHPLRKKIAELKAHHSKLPAILFILVVLLLIVGAFFLLQAIIGNHAGFTLSGTIEATEIHLGSEVSGRVSRVYVKEGENVTNNQVVAEVRGDKVHSTIDGVVMDRAVEPGEIVAAGTTLITVADLNALTLTVYIPEDQLGQVQLGQMCQVKVDSYPGQTFWGTVIHIANKAEFTPRNVQTTESRKNTVFGIKLDMAPTNGLLKPGMPADVTFQNNP